MAKGKKNEEVIVEAPVVEEVITVKVAFRQNYCFD